MACDNGYEGTEMEWLASLVGESGNDGKSAYDLAVEKGFDGTEEEWLASLIGPTGATGANGNDGKSA
ncbi:MAG: collagen-like protein, partial [Clostridia bacterium]|nr:collagen-like protein [Clostridia bacterium]